MAVLRLPPAICAVMLAMTSPALAQALLPSGRRTLTVMPSETRLVWGSVITNNGDPCCEATTFMGDHPEAKQVLRIIDGSPQWEC